MEKLEQEIVAMLCEFMTPITARSVLDLSIRWSRVDAANLGPHDKERLLNEIRKGIRLYVADAADQERCVSSLSECLASGGNGTTPAPPEQIVSISVQSESDIVLARNEGRAICEELGFTLALQIKVSTAISELARNIVLYAGNGQIVLRVIDRPALGIEIIARDQGPGIDHLEAVLSGRYDSKTGMGMGLFGTRNLMDDFHIDSQPGRGTEVIVRKYLQ
jgi:serine/threonine-protein kinase RsbT